MKLEDRLIKTVTEKFYDQRLDKKLPKGRHFEERMFAGSFTVETTYDKFNYRPPFVGGTSVMVTKDNLIVCAVDVIGKRIQVINSKHEAERFLEMVGEVA